MKKTQIGSIALMAMLMLSLSSIPAAFADPIPGSPDTENIEGKDWYYWNATNDKAAIILYGGLAVDNDTVRVLPLNYQTTNGGGAVITYLYANGFDVLTNKYPCDYEPGVEDTFIYNASTWLFSEGYDEVHLFGWSAGGAAVAHEIQKAYASMYSSAVIADAPLDYDGRDGEVYHTAQNADDTKVPTAFICNETDPVANYTENIYTQMELYYDNMVVSKEWHDWTNTDGNAHDPFADTCAVSGQTVGELIYYWSTPRQVPVGARDEYDNWFYDLPLDINGKYAGNTCDYYYLSEGDKLLEVPSSVYPYWGGYTLVFQYWEWDGNIYYDTELEMTVTSDPYENFAVAVYQLT